MDGITVDWNCVSCSVFGQLDQLATRYGREVFVALLPATRETFASFIGVWFAYQLLYKGIFRGELSFQVLLPKLALFFFLQGCLWSADFYWDYVYIPIKETTSALAQVVVTPAGGEVLADKTMMGLLRVVEQQVFRVIKLSLALMKDAGWSVHLVIGALVLVIPYLFVWCVFLAFMLEGMFKLLAITVLAPLAIVAAGFEPTRSFTVSAARVLLGGALTVIFASVAMGFTVAVLRYYTGPDVIPVDESGEFAVGASGFVFDKKYLAVFILGFISILFHLKAATLASNISGALDGPGAAAAVVGAGMSLMAAAKTGGMSLAAKAGKMAADGGKSGVSAGAQKLMDRFTRGPNYGGPKSGGGQ